MSKDNKIMTTVVDKTATEVNNVNLVIKYANPLKYNVFYCQFLFVELSKTERY